MFYSTDPWYQQYEIYTNKLLGVPRQIFQPSLIFVSKVEPSKDDLLWLKRVTMHKHSSLRVLIVSDEEENFSKNEI
jgi:hypothetical protein